MTPDRPARRLTGAASSIAFHLRAAPVLVGVRLATAVLAGFAPVVGAWTLARLVDALTDGADERNAVLAGVGVATVAAAAAVIQHVSRYLDSEVARRVGLRLQSDLFAAVSRDPGLSRLEDPRFHDRLQLSRVAAQTVPQIFTPALLQSIQALVALIGFFVAMVVVFPAAAVVAAVAIAPSVWAQRRLSRLRSASLAIRSPHERRLLFYATTLTDLRVAKEVRLFDLGEHLRGRLVDEVGAIQETERRVDRRTAVVDSGLAVLAAAVLGGLLVGTVLLVLDGHGTVGQVTLLVASLAGMQAAAAGLVSQAGAVDEGAMLLDHYRAVVEGGAPVQPASGAVEGAVEALQDSVVFHDVWFRYADDQPWVLRGVDLVLRRGECTAIVGVNGAGKSTIAKLLCRLYEPDRGRITWDGTDIATVDVRALRERMSAVFQDFVCWELSAHENVAFGSLAEARRRPESVHEAARSAGVEDLLAGLPAGYDTILSRSFSGEPVGDQDATTGVVLSGGQWQRVAAARAFLRTSSDVLVLDEPSSGLDPVAEADLLSSLVDARRHGTCLVISHRVRAVRGADQVVVLDDGAVIERGTHAELQDAGGSYARWLDVQADALLGGTR